MEWSKLLCNERLNDIDKVKKVTELDCRSEFEKDYHRIVISSSLRRLQDKTQVFPLDSSDFVRTRLTHSLEVSSIAKSLGQLLSRRLIQKGEKLPLNFESDVTTILSCSGLIHDIGNPPFGHFGEDSIRYWFKKNLKNLKVNIKCEEKYINEILKPQMIMDLENFEGNAQALRIVSKLHFLVDHKGMDLTAALLNTIIKYPNSASDIDKRNVIHKKYSYFYSEQDIFDIISKKTGTFNNRHPLTFLLEAADDIAYCTADIEDGFKKGKFTYEIFLKEIDNKTDTSKFFINILKEKWQKAFDNDISNIDLYSMQNFLISVQSLLIRESIDCFVNNYDLIMSGEYKKTLFYNEKSVFIIKFLKTFAFKYIFNCNQIKEMELSSNRILTFLMDNFVNAALCADFSYFDKFEKGFGNSNPVYDRMVYLLSENYKASYFKFSENKSCEEKLYLRILLATDYICGMTDSFAKNLYQKLNGIT